MAKAASDENLREAIEHHLTETKGQVERLNRIGKELDVSLSGKKCVAMEGLIDEGKEALELDAPDAMLDLAIISAAQKVEHYEMSAYGTARALAEHLGQTAVANLLQESLDEESAANEKLTGVTQESVLPNVDDGDSEDDEDDEVRPARRNNRKLQKASR
jgi:ferritin-like metal-binding protein YciE